MSKPRTLSPVVSRFKGWFIDITDKAKPGKLDGVGVVEGISLASKSRDTSAWQFVETKKGYLVRAAAGKYKGWYIVVDDSAKTRPEGPTLTVTPALRLAKRPPANSHWKLTLAKLGLVLEATSGKYKGWFWDFGGGGCGRVLFFVLTFFQKQHLNLSLSGWQDTKPQKQHQPVLHPNLFLDRLVFPIVPHTVEQ